MKLGLYSITYRGIWYKGDAIDVFDLLPLAKQQGWSLSDEFFYRTFGMQNYQIIPMLAGDSLPPEEIENLSIWKEQRYRELIAGKLTLLDGVKQLLDDLTSCGFRLAIGGATELTIHRRGYRPGQPPNIEWVNTYGNCHANNGLYEFTVDGDAAARQVLAEVERNHQ